MRVVEVVCLSTLRLIESTTAYPDGHPDGQNDRETEFRYLKEKVDAGANFIVTQLFYDVDAFLGWVKEIRAIGSVVFTTESTRHLTGRTLGITVPIIPGIMPLQTYASFLRITKLCGTSVPSSILADLDEIKVGNFDRSRAITSFSCSMTTDS